MAMLGQALGALTMAGLVDIDGDAAKLEQLIALLDNFEFWFNIVTP
jgi:alkyl sulfatase BDS1-like metallo-beta-lactamase superfamily hydrolase